MRIVLLNDLLPPDSDGGLELSAQEIGDGLKSRGHDVQFVCSRWRESYQGEKTELPWVHRILSVTEGGAAPGGKVQTFRAIHRKINVGGENYQTLKCWLKKNGPFDVALVFGILRIGLGVAHAFTDSNIPIVWSVGDVAIPVHFSLPSQTRLYWLAFNTVGRKWHQREKSVDFSHMLVTSDFVRQELKKAGIRPKVCEVVPRAIDFDLPGESDLKKEQPPSMLVACRLSEARGVHVAIEAAIKLSNRRPDLDWRLKIAGSGDPGYLAGLQKQALEAGDKVKLLGKLEKPALLKEMKAATIAINPTIEVEGFGRTNIEAMACFTALIATDIPSIHEIVERGWSAEIVPADDSDALSTAMERLLTDVQYRDNLTKSAREKVQEAYTFTSVLDVMENHLQRAIQSILGSKTHKFPSD